MGERLRIWLVLGVFGVAMGSHSLLLAQPEETVVLGSDYDARLTHDQPNAGYNSVSALFASGDFNGDGKEDFALFEIPGGVFTYLFLGGEFKKTETTVARANAFISSGSGERASLNFVDIDHDGKDDLVLVGYSAVDIFLGREIVDKNGDWLNPDIKLVGTFGGPSAVGDFNGDSIKDVAIGAPNSKRAYVLFGKKNFPKGNISVSDGSFVETIKGKSGYALSKFGSYVVAANINNDAFTDLIVSDPGVGTHGESYGLFGGSTTWPSPTWDVDVSPPPLTILGGSFIQSTPFCIRTADLNVDGYDDLFFIKTSFPGNGWEKYSFLDGKTVADFGSLIDLEPGSPESLIPVQLFLTPSTYMINSLAVGDFDGDGFPDIFTAGASDYIRGLLSSDFSPGGIPLTLANPGNGSLTYQVADKNIHLADVNGDGVKDLITYEFLGITRPPPYALIHIVYGFQPLKAPSLMIFPGNDLSARVTLNLGVSGHPTEMMISGDLTDSIRDQWIPFAASYAVDLTPGAGPKTINVVFRNAQGRLSIAVSAGTTLDPTKETVRLSTNRLAPGGVGRWEVSKTEPGHLRARIFSAEGDDVVVLEDVERSAGIWPITWDGSNAFGRRVASGFYLLIIESGGQTNRIKIAVTNR